MAGQQSRPLRWGWTTGACAAAAARAAFTALLSGRFPDPVAIRLPRGATASFPLALSELGERRARAGIVKDAGDDPDVTHGALVVAGILDDGGTGAVFAQFCERQRETRGGAPRQADRDRVGKPTGQQGGKGRARRCGGTGAGRPTAPQRSDLLPCHRPILAKPVRITKWSVAAGSWYPTPVALLLLLTLLPALIRGSAGCSLFPQSEERGLG